MVLSLNSEIKFSKSPPLEGNVGGGEVAKKKYLVRYGKEMVKKR